MVLPIGNVVYNGVFELYICAWVIAMVAERQAMKTDENHQRGRTHSKGIKTTMPKYNQQATGNGCGREARP